MHMYDNFEKNHCTSIAEACERSRAAAAPKEPQTVSLPPTADAHGHADPN